MTIKEAQKEIDQWIQSKGVRYFDELTNMSQLTEEVGELARVISREFGEQSFKEQPQKSRKELLREEIADVLFVLICIANQTEIDLEAALKESIEKKSARDGDRHKNNPKLN